uniref:S-crystallin 10 n=1 Tax=Idiosepius paradoxus TaxID=294707 RepID=A0A0H5ANV1_IDIPA|nr:S-crystallin 10 [Idiosepius paradoxus]
MPNYTLYYFSGKGGGGKAEICRMLFVAGNQKYEDRRIEVNEWDTYKGQMPGSVLPILEIDSKVQIPQNMAIARYLAREFGYHGRNNIEQARVDYISDNFHEIHNDFIRFDYEKDPSKARELRHVYEETCRKVLPFMEDTLKMNYGGDGWFIGDKMLMCDMMCHSALENPLLHNNNLLKTFPKLESLRRRVKNQPELAEYFKRHKDIRI